MQTISPAMPMVAWSFLFIVGGVLALFVLFLVILLQRDSRSRRRWRTERMDAFDSADAFPAADSCWARAWVCTALGAITPVGSFFFTWLMSFRSGMPQGLWVAPTVVSIVSVGCTTGLAVYLFGPPRRMEEGAGKGAASRKPYLNPEELDILNHSN